MAPNTTTAPPLQPCHNDWAAPRLQSARPSQTRTDNSSTKAPPQGPARSRLRRASINFGERQAQCGKKTEFSESRSSVMPSATSYKSPRRTGAREAMTWRRPCLATNYNPVTTIGPLHGCNPARPSQTRTIFGRSWEVGREEEKVRETTRGRERKTNLGASRCGE